MNPIQHHDIYAEQIDESTIRLGQTDYSGNGAVIDLHPDQLRAIADRFAPAATQTITTPTDIVLRRFKAVAEAIDDIMADEYLERDLREQAAGADDLYNRLLLAVKMAEQYITDSEAVIAPACHEKSRTVTLCHDNCHDNSGACHDNCHDNSGAFSVTSEGRRGRPATGQAMTDAERQAKRRAKPESVTLESMAHS